MKYASRAVALLATGVMAAGALTAGAGTANAATISFSGTKGSGDDYQIIVVRDNKNIGYVYWNSDPEKALDWPGDAFRVSDISSDGYGIEARLTAPSRKATTRGQDAPYTSPWATGDLVENVLYNLRVCLVKGTYEKCSREYEVKA
ncbi:hypothetical protein YW7DRAFT_05970 [Streptomyces sp. AmelKG-E11A]|nr:hypothetical protein YW7DRAFT_05970 [Streptomyces sp. AmelKG-E11A]